MSNWQKDPNTPEMHYVAPAQYSRKGLSTRAAVVGFLVSLIVGGFVGAGLANSDNTASETVEKSTARPTLSVSSKPTAKPSKAPEKPKSAEVTITAGTYAVGKDVPAGTYKSSGNDALCYWARMKDTSGDMGKIISNGLGEGNHTVTLKKTDGGFKTSGCNVWVLQVKQ